MKLSIKELDQRIRRWAVAAGGVILILLACSTRHLFGYLIVFVGSVAAGFLLGRLSTGPSPKARSLAQHNRHLHKQLDATRAKLEAEMARNDRAEEAAWPR